MYSTFHFVICGRTFTRMEMERQIWRRAAASFGTLCPKAGRTVGMALGGGSCPGMGDAWGKLQNAWVFSESPHNPTKEKPAKTFWAFTGFLKKAMQFSCVSLRRLPWSSLVPAQDSRYQTLLRSERAAAHFSLFSELLQTLPTKAEGLEKPGAETPELPVD